MPRNGPVFVSSKQVTTYSSSKSGLRPQKSVEPVYKSKAPAPRKQVAPSSESPAQCLQRLIKNVPAEKQLIVALRLLAVIITYRAALDAVLQQELQWAWLSAYEATRQQHCQELHWGKIQPAHVALAPCGQPTGELSPQPSEQTEAKRAELACSEPICALEPCSSKQQPSAGPVVITVFTYEPEDLPSAAVEEVSDSEPAVSSSHGTCSNDGNDDSSSTGVSGSSSHCVVVTSNSSIIYNSLVISVTSVFVAFHLIRLVAYCALATTCYTAVAVDVAICSVLDAEVTAVAVASCRRLSDSMFGSFKHGKELPQ